MTVVKRDGREVDFDELKIHSAVLKACQEVGLPVKDEDKIFLANSVSEDLKSLYERALIRTGFDKISVEEIQDDVENALMDSGEFEVAKAYIRYRHVHNIARDKYTELMEAVNEKISGSNVQNQNANVDEKSFGGRLGEVTGVVTRKLALNYFVSDLARTRHENNEIYIHDLDQYAVGSHNCLTIPFDKLLKEGFNTRQTDVRPANSVNTAFQLVAVIFQLQSLQQFGGVSASHLDWTMVPYVRKSFYKHYMDGLRYLLGKEDSDLTNDLPIDSDQYKAYPGAYKYAMDLTEREVYQAAEGMLHNLNTLQSRSGNQLPFTSVNLGTCTLPEGRMVTKALLEVTTGGIGKLHKTSIFPCSIFQYMRGVNDKPGTPNYDLKQMALRATAQRLYPNYANVDWSGNAGYDVNDPCTFFSTMGKCKCSSSKTF